MQIENTRAVRLMYLIDINQDYVKAIAMYTPYLIESLNKFSEKELINRR